MLWLLKKEKESSVFAMLHIPSKFEQNQLRKVVTVTYGLIKKPSGYLYVAFIPVI
jgi:hypothetical protein